MKKAQFKQENQSKPDFLFSKTSKKSLRLFYQNKLSALPLFQKKQKTKKINQILLKMPFWDKARFIAVYKAFQQEPCLSSFCSVWKDKICFPVIKKDQLAFYTNKEELWQKNQFNIREPIPKKENRVKLKDISVFLIPGLAFDRRGGRLGRGYAYYDRALSKPKKNSRSWDKPALFIGLAFIEQIHSSALPLSQHDILMDYVATDQFVLQPLTSKQGGK